MIEIQVRRPCDKPEPERAWGVLRYMLRCPRCGIERWSEERWSEDWVEVRHNLVIEWLPLAEAMRLAHEEECREAADRSKVCPRCAGSGLVDFDGHGYSPCPKCAVNCDAKMSNS